MKWISTLLFIFPLTGHADWFGAKTYEDCILDGMKGTTSDVAAKEIKRACRTKFPQDTVKLETIKADEISQYIGDAELSRIQKSPFLQPSINFKKDHKIKFHNSSLKKVIYMTLAIVVNDSKSPRLYREFVGADPRSAAEGLYEFQLSKDEKITSWWVHEIEIREPN